MAGDIESLLQCKGLSWAYKGVWGAGDSPQHSTVAEHEGGDFVPV